MESFSSFRFSYVDTDRDHHLLTGEEEGNVSFWNYFLHLPGYCLLTGCDGHTGKLRVLRWILSLQELYVSTRVLYVPVWAE